MNPLNAVKFVTDIAISFGIGSIIGNVIKTHAPAKVNLVQKIAIGIGGSFLSSMITDKVSSHASEQIDKVAESVKKTKETLKELAKNKNINK
jgi:hypothetical protein